MSLEKYMTFPAPRVGLTIPVTWGSERKIAYFHLGNNIPVEVATGQDLLASMEVLYSTVEEFSRKHTPVLKPEPQRVANPQPERKPMYCYVCRDNGYPTEQIKLNGKDESGKWKPPSNPDGTIHKHKQKAT